MAATTELVLYPFSDFKAIVGEPLYCLAEAIDSTGAVATDSVTFSSSNPSVATIDSATGQFTPIANGTTTITATAGSVSVTRTMTVVTPQTGVPIASAVTRPFWQAKIAALSSPGPVVNVDASYAGNLQNAVNAAAASGTGWTLQLTPGVNYGNLVLPENLGALITLTTSGTMPSRGTRMTAAQCTTHNSPRIWTTTTTSAVTSDATKRVRKYRFVGLDIGYPSGGTQKLSNYGAFNLDLVSRLSLIPQEIHLDRVFLRGSPNAYNSRFGFSADGAWVSTIDCAATEHHFDASVPGGYGTDANYDSQGMRVVLGPGPIYSENCQWQSSHEPVAYGGGASSLTNMILRDARLYRCYLGRPASWKGVYTAKNIWESKQGLFLENEDCVYDHVWVDNQNGYCFMLTPTSSGSPVDFMVVRDVWMHGAVLNVVGGIASLSDQNHGMARATFENIACIGMDADPDTGSPGANGHVGVAFRWLTGVGGSGYIPGITVRHITAFNRANNFISCENETVSARYADCVVEDNNVGEGTNGYGLIRSNSALEKTLWDVVKGANARWRNNLAVDVFAPGRAAPGGTASDTNNTYFPAVDATQVVTPANATSTTATLADLALPAGSPYKGTASDGTDPGADLMALASWYSDVIAGNNTGTPVDPGPGPLTYAPCVL